MFLQYLARRVFYSPFFWYSTKAMLRASRTRQKLALLMIDIDNFKSINDCYGHPSGDRVICQVTEICEQLSREIDTVGRLGEKFAIMLLDSDLQLATEVAERIRKRVAQAVIHSMENVAFKCTVSIGVAELHPADKNEQDLTQRYAKLTVL